MSYKGYVQKICPTGHYKDFDCYMDEDTCIICDRLYVWEHSVDQTNDEGIEFPVEIAKEAETDTCHACGHTKIKGEDLYKLPTKKQMEEFFTEHFQEYKENY